MGEAVTRKFGPIPQIGGFPLSKQNGKSLVFLAKLFIVYIFFLYCYDLIRFPFMIKVLFVHSSVTLAKNH